MSRYENDHIVEQTTDLEANSRAAEQDQHSEKKQKKMVLKVYNLGDGFTFYHWEEE